MLSAEDPVGTMWLDPTEDGRGEDGRREGKSRLHQAPYATMLEIYILTSWEVAEGFIQG